MIDGITVTPLSRDEREAVCRVFAPAPGPGIADNYALISWRNRVMSKTEA